MVSVDASIALMDSDWRDAAYCRTRRMRLEFADRRQNRNIDMKLENDWICVNYPKLNKETSTLGDKPQDATNSSVAPMAKVEGVIHKGKSAKRKQNSQ